MLKLAPLKLFSVEIIFLSDELEERGGKKANI